MAFVLTLVVHLILLDIIIICLNAGPSQRVGSHSNILPLVFWAFKKYTPEIVASKRIQSEAIE
jgi:hypothetical protein